MMEYGFLFTRLIQAMNPCCAQYLAIHYHRLPSPLGACSPYYCPVWRRFFCCRLAELLFASPRLLDDNFSPTDYTDLSYIQCSGPLPVIATLCIYVLRRIQCTYHHPCVGLLSFGLWLRIINSPPELCIIFHSHVQDLYPGEFLLGPPELERASRQLQFSPSYAIVHIYRLATDKSLHRPKPCTNRNPA